MGMNLCRYIDGEKIEIKITDRELTITDFYDGFNLEIYLGGVGCLMRTLEDIRCFSDNKKVIHLASIIRGMVGYPYCWSNTFVVDRAKVILKVLSEVSSLEIDKDKLDKFVISDLKYIEAKLPSGIKKVDGKVLISLFSID